MLDSDSNVLNPFYISQGSTDEMSFNNGNRVGDQISLKGMTIKFLLENPIDRCNTHYRIMLLRGAKGETFDRSTIFKNDSANKLLDVINTERFTVIAQKIVQVKVSAGTGNAVGLTGIPGNIINGGIASKYVSMWIPGSKFARGGNIQYENSSASQVKFFDYRILVFCYDWFGTPQDVNTVGNVNEVLTKLYFKDA